MDSEELADAQPEPRSPSLGSYPCDLSIKVLRNPLSRKPLDLGIQPSARTSSSPRQSCQESSWQYLTLFNQSETVTFNGLPPQLAQ